MLYIYMYISQPCIFKIPCIDISATADNFIFAL